MRVYILIFLFLIPFFSKSQEEILKVGPKCPKEPEGQISYFNLGSKQGYLVFSSSKQLQVRMIDQEYLHYSDSVKAIRADVLSNGGEEVMYRGLMGRENRCYMLYSIRNKKQNEESMYVHELGPEMVLQGSPIKVASLNPTRPALFPDGGQILTARSEDGKFLVFVQKDDEKLQLKGFRFDTGEKWSKTVELDSKFSITSRLTKIMVDKSGNVYVLGAYYDFRRDDDKDPFLLVVSSKGDSHFLNNIHSEDKTTHVGYSMALLDDKAIVAGIYSKTRGEKNEGYEIFNVNTTTLKLEPYVSKPMTEAFRKVMHDGAYKPQYFSVNGIAKLENGAFALSFEGGVSSQMRFASTGYGSPAYVVAIDNSGAEKWNTIIQKPQVQPQGGDLTGHVFLTNKNKVYLIYNDNPDNFELTPTTEAKSGLLKNKMYVAVVEVDESGKSKKLKWISKSKEQFSSVLPASLRKVDKGLFHLTFQIGKNAFYYATFSGNEGSSL